MRITGATIYALRIPFVEAFSHSTKSRQFSDSFVVRVTAQDGATGYGEGVARPYVTGETVEASLGHIENLLWPAVVRCDYPDLAPDPDPVAALSAVSSTLPDKETPGIVAWHAARAGVELALIDCLLKRRQLSLAQLLPPKRAVVTYSGVITAGSLEKAVQHAKHFKLFGIRQLKIKIGGAGEETRARVAAIRETVGANTSLRLDANGAYDVAGALDVLSQLAQFQIDAVEQPIRRGDPFELAEVKRQSPIPVMADESLVTVADAEALIDAGACDYFNLRLSKCGGLARTLELARMASDSGLRLQLGSQVGETAILSAAGRHVAAYLDDVDFLEGSYGSLLLKEDIGRDRLNFGHGGKANALRGHGLGVKVREEILEKYAVSTTRLGEG
jgi:L-alanine-DL-glutamate epimerase-like enolase superfamily enzyme